MRLWSLHPSHLDRQGLLAVWQESLLAQQVLNGGTRGYRHHPQLLRFREAENPRAAIATYLMVIADEAQRRGYRFDRCKIPALTTTDLIPVTQAQIDFERQHLQTKLAVRDQQALAVFQALTSADPSFVHLDTRTCGHVGAYLIHFALFAHLIKPQRIYDGR